MQRLKLFKRTIIALDFHLGKQIARCHSDRQSHGQSKAQSSPLQKELQQQTPSADASEAVPNIYCRIGLYSRY
jgi:hypothetical protein